MTVKPYFTYRENEILSLYRSAGWSAYYERPEMLRKAFAGSGCVLAAYEQDALVGILRAVGDGQSILFIQDILVRPDHQRRGIGTALVQGVLERYPHVYQIQLTTDDQEKTCAFYRSLGFIPLNEMGCRGFIKA